MARAKNVDWWLYKQHYDWSKVDHLIGIAPDLHIAQLLGCNTSSVLKRRRKMGLPAPINYNWESVQDLLGVLTDKEIAKRLGCTASAVAAHRWSHGIEAVNPHHTYDLSGVDHLLGIIPDKDIAQALGCCTETIRIYRDKKGIASHRYTSEIDWSKPKNRTLLESNLSGKEVAKILGCKTCNVCTARRDKKVSRRVGVELKCICGNTFKRTNGTQKFCSSLCSQHYRFLLDQGCSPEIARLRVAIASFGRTIQSKLKTKEKENVEQRPRSIARSVRVS